MDEIIVRQVDMPTDIKGMTVLDDDGNYNIYINDRLSHDMREKVYQHELTHIERGDHYRDANIFEKETFPVTAPTIANKAPKPVLTDEERRKRRADRRFKEMMRAIRAERHELWLNMNFPRQRKRVLTHEERIEYFMQLKKQQRY